LVANFKIADETIYSDRAVESRTKVRSESTASRSGGTGRGRGREGL